jgi:hypothetical protein
MLRRHADCRDLVVSRPILPLIVHEQGGLAKHRVPLVYRYMRA